jgi:hypothetical protein
MPGDIVCIASQLWLVFANNLLSLHFFQERHGRGNGKPEIFEFHVMNVVLPCCPGQQKENCFSEELK